MVQSPFSSGEGARTTWELFIRRNFLESCCKPQVVSKHANYPGNWWEEEDTVFSAHFVEIEPHNSLGWKRPLKGSGPTLFSKQGQLRSGCSGPFQLEILQPLWSPFWIFDHHHGDFSPLHWVGVSRVACYAFTVHVWEESWSIFFIPSR